MDFRIADTFTDSLGRLTGDEQKAVKTTAFDLQLNPASPGHNFHKLDKARDRNFWSVRVSRDIRLIVHKTPRSLLLCYVDHHDKAYAWAERRKLEVHPKTGAAQMVEIRETVQEIKIPKYPEVQQAPAPRPALFAHLAEDVLLSYGVPPEWLGDIRRATEDTLLDLAEHLPGEAAEALLELATGGTPTLRRPPLAVVGTREVPPDEPVFAYIRHLEPPNPYDHPDAQRRFREMANVEELKRALEFPWDKWTVFLHPLQRELAEADYDGPVRISGSAGTGKTIVALHRAVFLARSRLDSRVLLTTISHALAQALRTQLRRLISNEPRLGERLEVHSLNAIGERLYEGQWGTPRIASREAVQQLVTNAVERNQKFGLGYLMTEWEQVDAWQVDSWDAYRDIQRLGRKTRLPEAQRAELWGVLEMVRAGLRAAGLVTQAEVFTRLARDLGARKRPPFDHVVVDEAQDLSVPQLRFLAALGANRPNGLFFTGDLGQRIFQEPFSWKSVGVDLQDRSHTLHVNYRTSHQIRVHTDRLLGPQVSDVDGNIEERRGTISLFNGPDPVVQSFDTQEAEVEAVAAWLGERAKEGVARHEIAVFVRSEGELARARSAATKSGLRFKVLDEHVETTSGLLSICTMHLAKGLEFRAVAVMACDDEVIPLQSRIESVTDDADLEEVYNTERDLLYVACTRARDNLLVTSVAPASEFVDDLSARTVQKD